MCVFKFFFNNSELNKQHENHKTSGYYDFLRFEKPLFFFNNYIQIHFLLELSKREKIFGPTTLRNFVNYQSNDTLIIFYNGEIQDS